MSVSATIWATAASATSITSVSPVASALSSASSAASISPSITIVDSIQWSSSPLVTVATSLLAGSIGSLGLGALGGTAAGSSSLLGLLAGALSFLLTFSSSIRDVATTPLRVLLDATCTTVFVDAASPPATWLALFFSDLSSNVRLGREIEVEVVEGEADEADDEAISPRGYDSYGEPLPPLVGSAATKLHRFRLVPFAAARTFIRYESHLLIVSRQMRQTHSLTKRRYGDAQGAGRYRPDRYNYNHAESNNQETPEQIKYIKIRFVPLPRWPVLRLPFIASGPVSQRRPVEAPMIVDRLVEAAKTHFASANTRGCVMCYRYEYDNSMGCRSWSGKVTRGKRPLDSVVLPDGVAASLLDDARDFLARKEWYRDRGIAHRRGYLLFGAPGAGKTSLVTALASELLLNIYQIDLSDDDIGDVTLLAAINQTPPNAIILIEDIDCAFAPRLSSPSVFGARSGYNPDSGRAISQQALTLSGLLNAIDGVGASEGRITIATTNHITRLDPALIRPGRMDRQIAFKLATPDQAAGLFRKMLLPTPSELDAQRRAFSKTNTKSHKLDGDEKEVAIKEDAQRKQIERLADEFAVKIPDATFSTAALQGYLLRHKDQPQAAVDGATEWVLEQKADNEEQRRIAEIDWDLRLKLQDKEERRAQRKQAKLRKKALESEDNAIDSDAASEREQLAR